MQTFLPVADFAQSAQFLDKARLGKQRSETMIIYNTLSGLYKVQGKKGWPNHPATKMWTGYEGALLRYGCAIAAEWQARGCVDTTYMWFLDRWEAISADKPEEAHKNPPWLGDEAFHASHRSNLIRKNPEYYRVHWPNDPDDLPYIWPEGIDLTREFETLDGQSLQG